MPQIFSISKLLFFFVSAYSNSDDSVSPVRVRLKPDEWLLPEDWEVQKLPKPGEYIRFNERLPRKDYNTDILFDVHCYCYAPVSIRYYVYLWSL